MSHYNIFFSPTGGTKKIADVLSTNLLVEFMNMDLCQEISQFSLKDKDICIVSVPSYGGRVPEVAIERIKKIRGNGARVVLNCVYGNREWEDTLTELQDTLENLGFRCIAAIAAVAEHSIFRQFATGRPNEQDKTQLAAFCKKIQDKLDSDKITDLKLPGSHGIYKTFNGVPLKPMANDSCTKCGLCAKECPVGAINPNTPTTTDVDKCISCMRCISICPKHAKSCDANLMAMFAERLTPALSGHKDNHLFL